MAKKLDLERLSDAELEEYLRSVEQRRNAAPSDEQVAGGAPRELSFVMVVAGLLGLYASLSLIQAEKQLLKDPLGSLSCDINPLIGCGKFLNSPVNAVFFGVSNAVFGLAFFAGITALGLVLASGGRFGRWLWAALDLAMVGAAAWVAWFQWTSFTVEQSLCPYCLITWTVTIPLVVNVLARSAQAGHFPCSEGLRRVLVRGRWYIIAAVYVALVLFAVVWFWDQWAWVF
ncbi:MAG: vitamin K epoxide reductase family protein [Ancrocorticia sp.]